MTDYGLIVDLDQYIIDGDKDELDKIILFERGYIYR